MHQHNIVMLKLQSYAWSKRIKLVAGLGNQDGPFIASLIRWVGALDVIWSVGSETRNMHVYAKSEN